MYTFPETKNNKRHVRRKADYPKDGFNEISNTVEDNPINALSNVNQNQNALEKKVEKLDNKITTTEAVKNLRHQAMCTQEPKSQELPNTDNLPNFK